MKILEQNKVEQLLQIIQNKHGQRIVHFSDGSHIFTKTLSKLCKKYDHYYYLCCTKDVFYDKSITKYTDQPHMHITKFDLQCPEYMTQDIKYDYLISTLDFTLEDKHAFLAKSYPMISTGGNIILLVPNSKYLEHEKWEEVLTALNYVSPTVINNLFEHYDVIVSKRL